MEVFSLIITIIFTFLPRVVNPQYVQSSINETTVKTWATKLAAELSVIATFARGIDIQKGYEGKTVRSGRGEDLLAEITYCIQNATESKISAVRRIMDTAENTAQAHQDDIVTEYDYYNAKNLSDNVSEPNGVIFTDNKHFYDLRVNTSFSVVHVPTNVYDQAPDLLRAVQWSENLNSIFISNYNEDPSLSWQYFGSSLGFMRQYPAARWELVSPEVDVDLYDCRTRPWYIEAATSPKDIVILVDNSGSMTGMRREIARHVVNNILDTLGPNDFVNVFNFSDTSSNVVPCFDNGLVQATLENIRELKQGMEDLYTDKIANFSEALRKSFQLLQDYREYQEGACCNQAIMLITDGVPYNFKEIFQEYNWKHRPEMPVRVFTYLIGREVADVREVKWMACANQGYFVHLSTLSEVKEKVLEYIPVMARPLVLWRNKHPTIWTSVYADVADPKMTDWLWDSKESEDQREIFLQSRKANIKDATPEEQIQKYLQKRMSDIDEDIDQSSYQLMTSVSMPVLDRRENATRIAYLLGVAGTDVPIKDIQELMMPHRLGVNAYAFLVTNNGHIVIHPDFRPVFQGILKPSYNSVDMTEVELLDDDTEPRAGSDELYAFRDAVINQSTGSVTLDVKYHYDKMKRASNATRKYYYRGIKNTPFTLVISLPLPYGLYWIHAEEEISLNFRQNNEALMKYFDDNNWKIHPDWVYCRYHFPVRPFDTPEAEFKHFLKKSTEPNWKWLSQRTVTPPEHMKQSHTLGKKDKVDETTYFCDRSLFLSLVFDGKVTELFSKSNEGSDREELHNRIGITVSFVATHSGLTRWKDYLSPEELRGERHFSEIHNKAIDEIWYKRAVDYHFVDPHSYVYSVPYEAGDKNNTLVTASHAIFHTNKEDWKTPVAVIGFQFRHAVLHSMFENITFNCPGCSKPNKTCESNEFECYVIDNNGYIIVSKSLKETGKFFGEVRASIMEEMVRRNMFNRIRIYDYQAVCFRAKSTGNCAATFITPLAHLKWMIEWSFGYILWMMAQTNLHLLWLSDGVYASDDDMYSAEVDDRETYSQEMPMNENNKGSEKQYEKWTINRTRPQPCDKEVYLYQMKPQVIRESKGTIDSTQCKRYFEVQLIASTNMILVIVDTLCTSDETTKLTVSPSEVSYNSSSLACFKVQNKLRRRRPPECINKHPEEKKIELCGGCTSNKLNLFIFLISWLALYVVGTGH